MNFKNSKIELWEIGHDVLIIIFNNIKYSVAMLVSLITNGDLGD